MVLATDMSLHFQQIKERIKVISILKISKHATCLDARVFDHRITVDAWQEMKKSCSAPDSLDRGSTMGFIVHAADISHPTKVWDLHSRWTDGLVEEFFRQVCNKKFQMARFRRVIR